MDTPRLAVEWVAIDRLHLNPANPRHNDDAVPHVAASLRRFGWQQPIVARPSGEVIAGNTRLKAARSLSMTQVPVVRFEGTDLDAVAFGIADNRTHEYSSWVEDDLAKILQELKAEDSLEGVGYSESDLDELIAELKDKLPPQELDDQGPEAPPVNPVTCTGDLWILGDHKILNGDSTKPDDLDRLMAGEKAELLATDPPYAVGYDGTARPVHNGKASGKDWSALYSEVHIKDLGAFLDDVFTSCLPHTELDAPIYVWHAHVQFCAIAATFEKHGLLLHQVLIWSKPSATFGHSYYRWKHEPCAFGWRRGHKPRHGCGDLETIWQCDWEGKSRVVNNQHPTVKPLPLFEIPMEQHTKAGAIVLEPFSGSGTQILAAEKLHRKCRAMEISPSFVDVAVTRWEKATGKVAVLDGDSRTFAEIKAERLGGKEVTP